MESETSSSVDEQVGGVGGGTSVAAASDTRGKHRILAELKRVEQESKFLEAQDLVLETNLKEELEELEKTDNVSKVCEELLRNIETRPDPLLPLTNGPVNPSWDRWFEGPQDPQGCKCYIL